MSFDKNSYFNAQANFTGVKFGEEKPVLEVELNELQEIQNEARADLVRNTIPSGFTTLGDIDYTYMSTNPNKIKLSTNSVAYVNGYKINIPKDTIINVGTPPEKEPREDLVFLEVWKEEVTKDSTIPKYGGEGQENVPNNIKDDRYPIETSRRVQLKWRIRVFPNVDFSKYPQGLGAISYRISGTGSDASLVQPQGGNPSPVAFVDWHDWFVKSDNLSEDGYATGGTKRVNKNDLGLYVSGVGDDTSKTRLKTLDGYVYAIPMFKVYRRPSCGYMQTNEYNKVSPLCDPLATKKITSQEKVAHSGDDLAINIKGRTLKNLLGSDGNCEDLSKWVLGGSGEKSKDSSVKNFGESSFLFKGVNNQSFTQIDLKCDQSHKYFISAYSNIKNYVNGNAVLIAGDYGAFSNYTTATFDTSKIGVWQRKSAIATSKNGGGMRIIIGIGSPGELVVNFDGIMVYDLTEIYGVGKEPTDIEQLERELPYVDGLQSSKPIAIKSMGKNLFDGKLILGDLYTSNGNIVESSNVVVSKEYIKVRPNNPYVLSIEYNEKPNWLAVYYYDFNRKFIGYNDKGTNINAFSFTTPLNAYYIKFKFNKAININAIVQLEEGTVATTYEPYKNKESQVILPSNLTDSLNTLPSGIKDETDLVNNKLTKRLDKVVFDGSEDETWSITGWTTSDVSSFAFSISTGISETSVRCMSDKFSSVNRGSHRTLNSEAISFSGSVAISIAKSKLETQDVDGFKKWLKANPVTVYYLLDTPIEYDITDLVKGRLYVNPETTTFQVDQVSQKEVTPKGSPNLIANGDFSKDRTGWIKTDGTGLTITGDEAKFEAKKKGDNLYHPFSNGSIVGHKYYVSALVKATSPNIDLESAGQKQFHTGTGKYEKLSVLVTATGTSHTCYIADNNETPNTFVYIRQAFTVDLTEMFGVGNEPTKEWCDSHLEFGTNYLVTTPKDTTVIAIERNDKDVFKVVYNNFGLIPSTKYREGTYKAYYNNPFESAVLPTVEIKCGSKSISFSDGIASLDLTNDVPYKKHFDGAIPLTFTTTLQTLITGTTTTNGKYFSVNVADGSKFKVGDMFKVGNSANFIYEIYFRVASVSANTLGIIQLYTNVGYTLGLNYKLYKVDRLDKAYSDIVYEGDLTSLRHQVSLTGFNYQQLLEKSYNKLLKGEL